MHLLNLRTTLLCALSFMRFLRFSEVINLKCLDIILKESHMSIFIENGKTEFDLEDYWMHLSKHFSLHSLRSGGATTAASFGISDRLFQKHVRWKSENVKNE